MHTIEYYKDTDGWRWRIRRGKIKCNGGQGFSRKIDMMNSIKGIIFALSSPARHQFKLVKK